MNGRDTLQERLAPWICTLALVLLWEVACRGFAIDPFVLPPPSAVAGAFVKYWSPLAHQWVCYKTRIYIEFDS